MRRRQFQGGYLVCCQHADLRTTKSSDLMVVSAAICAVVMGRQLVGGQRRGATGRRALVVDEDDPSVSGIWSRTSTDADRCQYKEGMQTRCVVVTVVGENTTGFPAYRAGICNLKAPLHELVEISVISVFESWKFHSGKWLGLVHRCSGQMGARRRC